jgi:aerobic carbon-monoxide dehydrogenase medium subunit
VKPGPFEHHAPETVADAVGLLVEHGDDAKPLAGGQSLVPLLALRLGSFGHLVDLNRVGELAGITRANGHVRVGAMTRQRTAERDATVAAEVPLLADALPLVGHFQIRNRGTVGGSLSHADPASELPAVAAALDAELEIAGSAGVRTVAAQDFFTGTFTTAIDDAELLTAVRFPVWGPGSGFAVREFARRHGDFAVAGAAVGVQVDGGAITRVAVAFFGMAGTPVRSPSAEAGLVGASIKDLDVRAAATTAVADTDPGDDVHASAAHRRRIAVRVAADAITAAVAAATTTNPAAGGSRA